MKKKLFCLALCLLALLPALSGCAGSKDPVKLTMWHNYGGDMQQTMDRLIDQFNATVGAEEGIVIEVTAISSSSELDSSLAMIADGDPGAPDMPDIFTGYPKMAVRFQEKGMLSELGQYFTADELSAYVDAFVEEGRLSDGGLYVFPVAKSTEIMFINKTIFDRFSQATGVKLEDLDTWEGLFKAAEVYAAWTDGQTPDIPGDAKSMFVHDYYFNYFQVGAESLGEDFFQGDELAFGPVFQTAWEPLAQAALQGGVWLQGGYATESLRTGDSIVSVASSASILYYSDVVTYPDNTSEDITIISRPCPVFENGEKLVMQRGAGFCTIRSTPERERAAVTFLKWLTEPEHNVEFVTRTGYMPVTQTAFEKELPKAIQGLDSAKYASLYQAYLDTQKDYTFYVPPQLETYLSLEMALEDHVRAQLALGRKDYLEAGEVGMERISAERLQAFQEIMGR